MNTKLTLLLAIIAIGFIKCTSPKEIVVFELGSLLEQYANDEHRFNPLLTTSNGVNDYNDSMSIDIGDEYFTTKLKSI